MRAVTRSPPRCKRASANSSTSPYERRQDLRREGLHARLHLQALATDRLDQTELQPEAGEPTNVEKNAASVLNSSATIFNAFAEQSQGKSELVTQQLLLRVQAEAKAKSESLTGLGALMNEEV
jgi:hypothetical protein